MDCAGPWAARYGDYWESVGRFQAQDQLVPTSFFVLVCQVAFIGLDAWAYPEHFWLFFPVRMAVNVLILAILLWGRFHYPNTCQLAVGLAVGAEILVMIYATGGPESLYYTGLLLVFCGMPVLQPITVSGSVFVSGVCCAAFAVSPLFVGGPEDGRSFAIALIFAVSGGFESAVSCHVLTRARVREFEQRREIEAARDQLEVLDQEKSRFTANVHHELRTPLTLMLAPLEGMLGGDFGAVSELQRSYMHSMQSNALRLLKLINNLLDFAKIEGNQLAIKRRPTRVSGLVEQIVAGAQPMAEQKGIVLRTRNLAVLPEINVDPDAVEKVVVNLVGNALKFTSEGHIEVSGQPTAEGGIQLTVLDTGAGLPLEQLSRIFDRFAQVDGSSTRRHEGTGIGLSLVKELVQLHGGEIWAESDGPGEGSQFHVVLPGGEPDDQTEEVMLEHGEGSARLHNELAALESELAIEDRHSDELNFGEMRREAARSQPDTGESTSLDVPAGAAVSDASRPEVLVCEDNRDMRRLLSHLLSEEFRVRVAPNGRAGLELARQAAPDLILTDVMMPEMSGTELCKAVKDDPALQHVPVVLVTSKAEREMKIEGLELGADDYITKPFHPRELMARVRSLVKLRRAQAELDRQNVLLESTNAELNATLEELHEAGVQLVKSERLAAVGELAAGLAHEINNPMNFAINALRTMEGYVSEVVEVTGALARYEWNDGERAAVQLREVQKLRASCDFDEAASALRELLGIVTEGLDRTQRLVGDLRDFAAPGEERAANVDVARGLRTTAQLVNHHARDADVTLELEVPERLPPVAGDPGALNQVFLNLLKNATEALEGRGGVVRVEARSEAGKIHVEIRDDGPGIAPEVLPRVFEPFFTTKAAGRGTGLGLSISRRIVDEHGGEIDVESAEGRGTTFRVTLPCGNMPDAA